MTVGAAPRARSDLLIRTIAGVVMILVAVAALVFGGHAFWLLCAAMAMLMVSEWTALTGAPKIARVVALVAMAAVLIAALPDFLVDKRYLLAGLVLGGVVTGMIARSALVGSGVVYAGVPLLSLLIIRDQSAGTDLAFWTLAIVWATDIGAYFAGRTIGGAKLAPRISPNKTWAGLIGGMAAALIFGALLAWGLRLPTRLIAIAALLAVAAQLGDLFESWLKRRAGVKDSGRILPGHGGVLDRLDGLVPVATIIAALLVIGWI